MKIKTLLGALGIATLALQAFTFSATEAVAGKKHKKAESKVVADEEMIAMANAFIPDFMLDPKKVDGKGDAVQKYVEAYNKKHGEKKGKQKIKKALLGNANFQKLVADYKIMHTEVLNKLKATDLYQAMVKEEGPKLLTSNNQNKAVVDEVKAIYFPSEPQVPTVPNDKDKKK